MTDIKTVAIEFLNTGTITEGFEIVPIPSKKISYVKWVGSLIITDTEDGRSYIAIYETLIPLHNAKPEDEITSVTSVTPMAYKGAKRP